MTGVREAKRRAVRELIFIAARNLVIERGLDEVTVHDIAAAAGISTRTFFNYFPSKDDAIIGVEPAHVEQLLTALRNRPESETPAVAFHAVIFDDADSESIPTQWEQHSVLIRRHPSLLPVYLASIAELEVALAEVIGERIGIDLQTDPRPRAFVASALAVLRSTVPWWLSSNQSEPLIDVLDRTYWALVGDLTP